MLVERARFASVTTFVFADYQRRLLGNTQRKISLLTRGPDRSSTTAGQTRWVRLEQAHLLPPCRFRFTGGADDLSIDYASCLRVEWFLRLHPFLWDDEPSSKPDPYYTSSRIEHAGGRAVYLCDEYPGFRQCWMPRGQGGPRPVESPKDAEVRKAFIDARSRGALIWPVYGLQHFGRRGQAIMQLAVSAAARFGAVTGKRVEIFSFCPRSGHMPGDAWLQEHAGNCRLTHVGPVASSLYREILTTGELPPIVEGQESVSQLIEIRRPFLQLRRPERTRGFELADMVSGNPIAGLLDELSRSLSTSMLHKHARLTLIEHLAGFLSRCAQGEREVMALFSGLRPIKRPDKLDIGLAALTLARKA